MKKSLIRFLGLAFLGAALALPNSNASLTFAEGEVDTEHSYNLSFYDDFNGELKDGWSYAKGGSAYTYADGDLTKFGWLFNGQDHIQYKRHNNPSDFGKFLYGDSNSKNYVFEVKVRADTNMTSKQYIDAYSSELGKHLTINSMIPFFVQNEQPESAHHTFKGRGICFTNYAIGFWEYGAESNGWASTVRLPAAMGDSFTWADWHIVRVMANDNQCTLFIDGKSILTTAQANFKRSPNTNGSCGFAANIGTGYDSLHYDDFKFYEANPNYKKIVVPTSTFDFLDDKKVTKVNKLMTYERFGDTNKICDTKSSATGAKYGTQLSTINQEYDSFDMDVAVSLDSQFALKNTTPADHTTKNIRTFDQAGIVIGSPSANLNSNYFVIRTQLVHTNSAYVNKSYVGFDTVTMQEGKAVGSYKKGTNFATVDGTNPYLKIRLKVNKVTVTVFANKADYEAGTIAGTSTLDISSGDGKHFGLRCNSGNDTARYISDFEILSFTTSDKGAVEYPSNSVIIAEEPASGPYTVSIPTLTNGVIKDGGTILTSDISMDAHSSKKLDIVPNEGYSIANVVVNGKNIGPAKQVVIDNITRNTSIEVTFTSEKAIDVYLIAGQSNAAGQTPINGLYNGYTYGGSVDNEKVKEYENGYKNIFYYGATKLNDPSKGNMEFDVVRAGEGTAAAYMGPELGFGEYASPILEKSNKQAAIIKYAVGATGFANSTSDVCNAYGNWLSTTSLEEETDNLVAKSGLLYTNLLSIIESGLRDLIDRGFTPVIKGFMWFQGCADAGSKTMASMYAHHLTNLINDLRNDIASIETKLAMQHGKVEAAVAKINDNLIKADYEDIVREQIQLVSETVDDVRVIDTKGMVVPNPEDNNDPWHFSSKDILEVGRMFAQVLLEENGYVNPETFTVTFDTDGGSEVAPITLKKWESLTLPEAPTKEGYIFSKWVVDGTEEELNYKDFSITSNITLKAVYEMEPGYKAYVDFINLVRETLKVEEGTITKQTAEQWTALKTAYEAIPTEAKEALKTNTAASNGSDEQVALYLYDEVLKKYGTEEFENFMGREVKIDPIPDTSSSSSTEITSSSVSSNSVDTSTTSETSNSSKGGCGGAIVSSLIGGVVLLGAAIVVATTRKRKE